MENKLDKLNSLLEDYVVARNRRQYKRDMSNIALFEEKERECKEKLIKYFLDIQQPKEHLEEVYYFDLLREFGKPSGYTSGREFKKVLLKLLVKYDLVLVHANGVEKDIDSSFIDESFGSLIPILGGKDEVLRRLKLYTLPVLNKKDNRIEQLFINTINNSIHNHYK